MVLSMKNSSLQLVFVLLVACLSSVTLGCTHCVDREQLKEYRKNSIKAQILRKLGYSSPPNITGISTLKSSRLIRTLVHKMEKDKAKDMQSDQQYYTYEDDSFQPQEITIIPKRTSVPSIAALHWDTLYFSLTRRIQHKRHMLTAANLMIHLPPAPSPEHMHALVKVYYIARDKTTGQPTQLRAKEVTWKLLEDRGGLAKIDLIHLVQKWLRNPTENLGIVVKVVSGGQELAVPSLESQLAPYLQLHLNRSQMSARSRRNADPQCSKDKDAAQCCRYPLTIDFEEFGWDWIVKPTTYEAYFCHGNCTLGYPADTPRAHILQMHPLSIAKPCCAANKFSGFHMLYFNKEGHVEKGFMEDMVAERCGCA